MRTDQAILADLAKKLGSNTALAEALGIRWGRLKNWRCYRDVPPAFRMRVATLANMHGYQLGADWVDRAQLNIEQGNTANGRASPKRRKPQKAKRKAQVKRRRAGAQQQRRGVSGRRHSGRGAAAAP